MMREVTTAEVQAVINIRPQPSRFNLRACSLCGEPIGYVFVGGRIGFDSNCGCTRLESPIEERSLEDFTRHFNQQSPEMREKQWLAFGGSLAAGAPVPPKLFHDEVHRIWQELMAFSTDDLLEANAKLDQVARELNRAMLLPDGPRKQVFNTQENAGASLAG